MIQTHINLCNITNINHYDFLLYSYTVYVLSNNSSPNRIHIIKRVIISKPDQLVIICAV